PRLLPHHGKQRLEFALRHRHWTLDDWKRVVWSDEAKINRLGSDGRVWAWRHASESPISDRLVQATIKFGGGNVMIWGAMTYNGVGGLRRVEGRMDAEQYVAILDRHLLRTGVARRIPRQQLIFMHD